MNRTLLLVFLLCLIHGSLSGTIPPDSVIASTLTEAQLFFNGISVHDRDNFIVYYLLKGLMGKSVKNRQDDEHPGDFTAFDALDEPEGFSDDLLNWTEEEFELEDPEVVELVQRGVVCLASGKCVSIGDVGSNCCLF